MSAIKPFNLDGSGCSPLDGFRRLTALLGAGGIGAQLEASLNVLAWPQVMLIILVILATVVLSEAVSAKVRHAII